MVGCTCGCCDPVEPSEAAEPDLGDVTCYCPVEDLIDVISRKYAMQIVAVVGAAEGARFKTLEHRLPSASTSTLSHRLDELASAGLLERVSFDEIPPRVEYRLTEKGRQLQARLDPLLEWASTQG